MIVGFAQSVEVVCRALCLSKMAPSAGLPGSNLVYVEIFDCLVTIFFFVLCVCVCVCVCVCREK